MGKMYFDANRLPEAEKAFRDALEFKGDDPRLKENQEYEVDIVWHLGAISYGLNNYDDMTIYLNNVLEKINDKHPYYSNSYLTLGHYYLMIDNFEESGSGEQRIPETVRKILSRVRDISPFSVP